jgi:hypothetical protein
MITTAVDGAQHGDGVVRGDREDGGKKGPI